MNVHPSIVAMFMEFPKSGEDEPDGNLNEWKRKRTQREIFRCFGSDSMLTKMHKNGKFKVGQTV